MSRKKEILHKFVEKAWHYQGRIEERFSRFGRGKYGRVIKMSRKPTYEEFMKTCMITGIGILAIGGLGFAIYYLWKELPGWFGF